MSLDDLKDDWNSPRNNLRSEQQREMANQFARQMIRRRRFQLVWLINTFFWLTVITVLAVKTVAMDHEVALGREWALLPLLTIPWLFALHFLRRHLKPAAPRARGEMSVVDSLRAALAANREEESHLRKVGVLFAVIIPVLALAVYQLRAAHKVSPGELVSMVVFFGAVLLLSGAGIVARYFGRVLPQQRKLSAVLAELEESAS